MTTSASRFLASTILASAAIVLVAAPARAATDVTTSTTTPLATSSAGDVTVDNGGTITVASGPAVTVDSNNNVSTVAGGTIAVGAANGAGAILVNPGTTSTINSAGTINVLETYTAPDTNGDGIADGPVASATNRYGIMVAPGAATSGSITVSGPITLDGLNSAGIEIDAPYTGDINSTATIAIKGDGSAALRTTAPVTGNVTLGGTVTVVGQGSQGAVLGGDVSGTVSIEGAISQETSYTTDAGTTQTLSRTALGNGRAAVEVDGNVGGGVIVVAPPYCAASNTCSSTTTTTYPTGSIAAFGNSPGLLIGSANNITIGTVAGRDMTASLVVDGTITSSAYYSRTDTAAVELGGQGGTVSLPGGISVSGTVSATTVDQGAAGILINPGVTAPLLENSGTISATITSPGVGSAFGIQDQSGTLTEIDNNGFIKVSASSTDNAAAIDLSANTTGVTIKQFLNATETTQQQNEQAASGYDPANATVYTSITGDIRTGSGNDLLSIASGKVTGNSYLGGGNDTVALSGDAAYTGNLNFGVGTGTVTMADTSTFAGALNMNDQPGTLTIGGTAAFSGTITGGSQLDVAVNSGSFGANQVANLGFRNLTVGSGGTVHVYVDGAAGASSQLNVATADFATGSKISATISSLQNAVGSYTILTSNALTGSPTFDATSTQLPVLFDGAVTVSGNDLVLDITQKTASELGLNPSETAAYPAIMAAALNDTTLSDSLLQVSDVTALQGQFDELLPDSAGGVFDFASRGARLASRHLHDASSLFSITNLGGWFEPVYFRGSKDPTGTAGFDTKGFGLSMGIERRTGLGNIGVSFDWTNGSVQTGTWQHIGANAYQLGLFWRKAFGNFYAYAQGGGGLISLSSTRTWTGTVSGSAVTYTSSGSWKGWSATGSAGASYNFQLASRLSLRPMATIDYYRLHENGYTESGATAIDLAVNSRNSSSLSATTTLTASLTTGTATPDYRPFTFEVEGGRRSQLSGHLGTTTAAFDNGTVTGTAFSIVPDSIKSGWLGEVRVLAGGLDYTWQIAGDAEQTQGGMDFSGRASLSVAF